MKLTKTLTYAAICLTAFATVNCTKSSTSTPAPANAGVKILSAGNVSQVDAKSTSAKTIFKLEGERTLQNSIYQRIEYRSCATAIKCDDKSLISLSFSKDSETPQFSFGDAIAKSISDTVGNWSLVEDAKDENHGTISFTSDESIMRSFASFVQVRIVTSTGSINYVYANTSQVQTATQRASAEALAAAANADAAARDAREAIQTEKDMQSLQDAADPDAAYNRQLDQEFKDAADVK